MTRSLREFTQFICYCRPSNQLSTSGLWVWAVVVCTHRRHLVLLNTKLIIILPSHGG